MWSLKNKIIWYFFIPLVIALLVFGPYIIWNLWTSQNIWWRIPIISGTVFDTAAYLQWLGQTANGLDIGGHLRWFAWPLWLITRLFPHASISEWWLISRWISMIAVIWASGWSIRHWSGLSLERSRLISLAFWMSFVLALGMRPGVFSWYLPFGIFSLTIPLFVIRELNERKFFTAIILTMIAIAASFVYSWFFIVTAIWLVSIWSAWFVAYSKKIFFTGLLFVIVSISLATPSFASWLSSSVSGTLFMDLQIKSGLGFTHLPQITNSFFALAVWIALCFVGFRGIRREDGAIHIDRIVALQWAWLAVLFAWLITPFTGVYLHNDHFRTPVVILSWISLAVWWSYVREGCFHFSRWSAWALRFLGVIALLFILNILRTPYTFDNDDLNILHFSHWFAIVMVIWLLLWHKRIVEKYWWLFLVLIGAILIGGIGAVSIYQREFKELPNRVRHVPEIVWIQKNIPANDTICSDPVQADFLATYTGRRIFPAGTTLYYREPSLDVIRRMEVYASVYAVRESGNLKYISYINHMGRSMICHQFPYHTSLLSFLGVSSERIDKITGCPRRLLNHIDSYTEEMISRSEVDAPAFRKLCPFILVYQDQQKFWRLPSGYTETPINSMLSVWHIRNPE